MSLHEEYLELLREHGLSLDNFAPTSEQLDKVVQEYVRADIEYFQNIDALSRSGIIPASTGRQFTDPDQERLPHRDDPFTQKPQHEKWTWLIEGHQEWLEQVLARAGRTISTPILVAQFPTGSVNAQARASKSGVLILLNTGLFTFVHKMTKIPYLVITQKWDYNAAERIILDTARNYILSQEAVKAPSFPPLPTGFWYLAGYHLTWIERFALAHEYAHVLNGDMDRNLVTTLDTPTGTLEVVNKSWEAEFKADVYAGYLLLLEYNRQKNEVLSKGKGEDVRNYLGMASRILSAPFYFFEIARLIEDVSAAMLGKLREGIVTDYHPPSYHRKHVLWQYFKDYLSQEELEEIGYDAWWLLNRTKSILGVDEEGNFTGNGLIDSNLQQ